MLISTAGHRILRAAQADDLAPIELLVRELRDTLDARHDVIERPETPRTLASALRDEAASILDGAMYEDLEGALAAIDTWLAEYPGPDVDLHDQNLVLEEVEHDLAGLLRGEFFDYDRDTVLDTITESLRGLIETMDDAELSASGLGAYEALTAVAQPV